MKNKRKLEEMIQNFIWAVCFTVTALGGIWTIITHTVKFVR